MEVCLGLHDFSICYNRFDVLYRLKDYFPDFKVSLFIIPYEEIEDYGPTRIKKELLKELKQKLDWIQLIPHGFKHHGTETEVIGYSSFKKFISDIEKTLNEYGLPYEKGFAPPHWRWNKNVVRVLDEMGWWGAISPARPNMLRPKRYYEYNFAIDEPFWESNGVLKLHGHTYGTRNDIGACLNNLMKLPKDTKFNYVTKYITNA